MKEARGGAQKKRAMARPDNAAAPPPITTVSITTCRMLSPE
jgi:hypothetical protein